MYKTCSKCNHTMAYDPYFKAYICRQCGCYETVKEDTSEHRYKVGENKLSKLNARKAIAIK